MARWLYMILRMRSRSSSVRVAGVDAQVVAGLHAALDRRTVADFFEPSLEVFEFVDVLTLGFPADSPRIRNHIGYRVVVAA